MRTSADRRPGGTSVARLALLVAAGGAVGTAARAQLELMYPPPAGGWPWVTFWINLAGSFVLGLLVTSVQRAGPDAGWRRAVRLGVGTGIVGGFTTYSTFVLEIERLVDGGHVLTGSGYAVVSIVVGLVAAGLGVALAGRVPAVGSRAGGPS